MSQAETAALAAGMAAVEYDAIAELLTIAAGTPVTRANSGFRVRETPTHWVDVLPQIYSWRVVTTPKTSPLTYDRFWCYLGTDLGALLRAAAAAVDWDGADGTEPAGWNKNGQTGQWRDHPDE